jgi:CheY-like chemotaxis protein
MSQLLQVSIPKKIEVRYELAEGIPAVEGDPVQLQQVVMNLITNAAEAIGDQPGIITLHTDLVAWTPGTVPAGDCIRLIVSDTGAGMDEATQARIFEPFFTTKFTGRGLGLAAVQGIVHGHHGTLTVVSEPGIGTTFTALLPAAIAAVPAPEPVEEPAQPRGNGTVLIVDDEEVIRRVTQRSLEHVGYRVLTAEDGARAVEIYRTKGPEIDLVILDLTMPIMDGPQTLRALRLIDPAVRVLLSSGFSEHDLSARGESVDEPFLQKPYRWNELVEKVKEALSRQVPA